MRASQRGHLYFELVEKGARDEVVGKIDAVIWRTDHLRVARALRADGQRIEDGHEIRCRGQIDFYTAGGRLQLIVREVDPLFSLGLLARRRRQTLAALEAAGLIERNAALTLAPVPLRLALVTSAGSAAYHDFLAGLAAGPYGFAVDVIHSAVQGAAAERELVTALERAASHRGASRRIDAIVVVRGGGARTDLAVFDSRRLAEAIARCPVPVLAGLGHEIDRSIADVVAHRAFKTPTEVAHFLVDRVTAADAALIEIGLGLARATRDRLEVARRRLRTAGRRALGAQSRLARAGQRIEGHRMRLGQLAGRRLGVAEREVATVEERLLGAAPRALERRRPRPEQLVERIAERARGRIAALGATLEGHRRLLAELEPGRVLARGFSITRDADGGLLRDPDQVREGARIVTELANGRIDSRVEENEHA